MKSIEDRLHPQEPWFTLRGKDLLAPFAIMDWAAHCRAAAAGIDTTISGIDDSTKAGQEGYETAYETAARLRDQATEAEAIAAEMISWQSEHPELTGLPD